MASQIRDTYELLTSPYGASFKEFFSIYADSIPLRERKTRRQISETLASPDYRTYCVKRAGVVIGFSSIFAPACETFCLLEYMAVSGTYRSSGVGKQLFRHIIQSITAERGDIPMLLEVDSERENSPDRDVRLRRKQFYKSVGCFQIDGLIYLFPLAGRGAPPEMDLMVYIPTGSPQIRKAAVEHWLKLIYQQVYGCDSDDPRIARMMKTVADPVKLVH